MIFYCGSKTPGLKELGTNAEENIRLTESKMVAAFCLGDPLEEPYCWFPCDFGSDGTIQYHELFPNAFKEACEGVKGYIYAVEAEEEDVIPSEEINYVCSPNKPLPVAECIEISDLYEWLMAEEDMGRFRLYFFEQKTRQEKLLWDNTILRYLAKCKMIDEPDCSYAAFVREKMPAVWEKYRKLCGK